MTGLVVAAALAVFTAAGWVVGYATRAEQTRWTRLDDVQLTSLLIEHTRKDPQQP